MKFYTFEISRAFDSKYWGFLNVCKWQYFKLCTSCSSTETWRSNFLAYTHHHPLTDMRVFPFFFFPWAGREILRSVILFDCLSFIVITKYGDNTYNSYDIVTLCLVFVCFRPYKAFDVIYIKKNILNFWNNVLKIVILKKSKFSIRQKDNLFLSGIFKWNLFLNQ